MAETETPKRKRGPLPEKGKRVVIREAQAIVLPEGFDADTLKGEAEKALKGLIGKASIRTVWEELGVAEGDKDVAIAAFAGEKGTPDAKPGLYRAPTLSSWKDGQRYKPPVQRVDAETVE